LGKKEKGGWIVYNLLGRRRSEFLGKKKGSSGPAKDGVFDTGSFHQLGNTRVGGISNGFEECLFVFEIR